MHGIMRDHVGISGRLSLARYCRLYVRLLVATYVVGVTGVAMGTYGLRWAAFAAFGACVLLQAATIPLVARRLHDRDMSGWWAPASVILALVVRMPLEDRAAQLVLIVGGAVVQVWLLVNVWVLKGSRGPNRHGPDPLGDEPGGMPDTAAVAA